LDGNLVAQKILYEKYKKIVKDYIRCKYSTYYDIDDDVSEIMIKIMMTLNTFEISKGKFKTWVMSITKNHMVDRWRENSIKLTSFNDTCITTIPAHNWDTNWSESGILTTASVDYCLPDSITFNDSSINSTCTYENCSSINYITAGLSPTDSTLLNMKYIEGYKYCEIGKEFNLTSATVSNKVNYIKSKLKKDFSEMHE